MELALRTPLADAVRNVLVSSWRRLSLHVRTLRLAAMGLTDAVRRQDQVLVVDEGGSEVATTLREVVASHSQRFTLGGRPTEVSLSCRMGERANLRKKHVFFRI
jgi:hypothetical protein